MKRNFVLFTILLLIILPKSVNAVNNKELTCSYYGSYKYEKYGKEESKDVTIKCDFYENNVAMCKISTSNYNQNISNWENSKIFKAKGYYADNKTCFPYMVFVDRNALANRYEIYAVDSYQRALEFTSWQGSLGYFTGIIPFSSAPGSELIDPSKTMYDKIESYTAQIKKMNKEDDPWSLNECLDEGGNLNSNSINYKVCVNRVQQFYKDVNNWEKEVSEAISSGIIDENDKRVKEFRDVIKSKRVQINSGIDTGFYENNSSNSGGNGTTTPSTPNIENAEIANFCCEPNIQNAFRFIGYLLLIVKIVIPIILIVLGVVDYAKVVTSSDANALQKSTQSLIIRIIAGVVIFLLPTIVNFVFGLLKSKNITNDVCSYDNCRICIFSPNKCGK